MSNRLLNAMPGDFIQMLWGLVMFGTNEFNLRSVVQDPPKFVLESVSDALGAWSARKVLPNGSVVELALIQFKKDERTRGRDDVLWGEWTIHIKGPETPDNPDGMILVFLCLHDYVWIKGLSATEKPQPPAVNLPPVPPPPADEWLTAESQLRHDLELQRIENEIGFPVDEDRAKSYMSGRNRNLSEVHDDELNRAGYPTDPCGGKNKVPLA